MRHAGIKIIFLLLLASSSSIFAQRQTQNYAHPQDRAFFIENRGQWHSSVRYLARMNGMNAWLTDFGVVYDYYQYIVDSSSFPPLQNGGRSDFSSFPPYAKRTIFYPPFAKGGQK
jgi:hypothetical protein